MLRLPLPPFAPAGELPSRSPPAPSPLRRAVLRVLQRAAAPALRDPGGPAAGGGRAERRWRRGGESSLDDLQAPGWHCLGSGSSRNGLHQNGDNRAGLMGVGVVSCCTQVPVHPIAPKYQCIRSRCASGAGIFWPFCGNGGGSQPRHASAECGQPATFDHIFPDVCRSRSRLPRSKPPHRCPQDGSPLGLGAAR